MKEQWKPIPGFEGYYSASNLGNIRRELARTFGKAGRVMKQRLTPHGYRWIRLSKLGAITSHAVHRLVAAAWHGPPRRSQTCINHKDNDRQNNRPENLEWCTPKENTRHAANQGRMTHGERHWAAKVTDDQAQKIREMYATGKYSQQAIADMFGLGQTGVSAIVRGKDRRAR